MKIDYTKGWKKALIVFFASGSFYCAVLPQQQTVRLFVAAEVPATVNFSNVQTSVKSRVSAISGKESFQPEQQFHITLAFIGEVSPDLIRKIKGSVEKAINIHNAVFTQPPHQSASHNVSVVPGLMRIGKTDVVAMKLQEPSPWKPLEDLALRIRAWLKQNNIPVSDYPTPSFIPCFVPHVVLGRMPVQLFGNPQMQKLFNQVKQPRGGGNFTVTKIGIYQSVEGGYQTISRYYI